MPVYIYISFTYIIYIYHLHISGWWFGTFFIFPYIGNNHPNWLIFFRGVQTTNQIWSYSLFFWVHHLYPFVSFGLWNPSKIKQDLKISVAGPRARSEGPDDPWDVCGAGHGGDHGGGDPAEGSGAPRACDSLTQSAWSLGMYGNVGLVTRSCSFGFQCYPLSKKSCLWMILDELSTNFFRGDTRW